VQERDEPEPRCGELAGGLGNPECSEATRQRQHGRQVLREQETGGVRHTSFWSDFDLVYCRDGKARRVESGVEPLVAGLSKGMGQSRSDGEPDVDATAEARAMQLKGYGNSIVAQLAAEFILSYRETIHDGTV